MRIKSAALKPRFSITDKAFLEAPWLRYPIPPAALFDDTAGSSGRFSICDSSFLISAKRLARISTADWSICVRTRSRNPGVHVP